MDSEAQKPFIVDGDRVAALIGNPETAKVKYVRLFMGDDSERSYVTMIELMAEISNWTERALGELTVAEVSALWDRVQSAIEDDAVDPTPNDTSSPGATGEGTSSPDGVAS